MNYELSYIEKHNLSVSALTDAQKTLHFIAENMRMQKSISVDGYNHFQQAIEALGNAETSQEQDVGHWIRGKYKDTCDKCRCTYPKNIGFKNYCPYCGHRMIEPQESEDE